MDNTPQVCLLYESEQERDELLLRLQHAGLGDLPRVSVDVSPGKASGRRFWTTRRSWEGASAASGAGAAGAGAAGAAGFLGSRWALVAMAIIAAGPLFLISHSAWGMIHSGRGLHLSRQPE